MSTLGATKLTQGIPYATIPIVAGTWGALVSTGFTLSQNSSWYFGMTPKNPTTTKNLSLIYFRQHWEIFAVELSVYAGGTIGSNEEINAYLRVNDSADFLIGAIQSTDRNRVFYNHGNMNGSGGNISVENGEFCELKIATPVTFATTPTGVGIAGYIWLK